MYIHYTSYYKIRNLFYNVSLLFIISDVYLLFASAVIAVEKENGMKSQRIFLKVSSSAVL